MIVAELFATLGLLPNKDSFDAGHELIESLHTAFETYLSYEAMKGVFEMFEGVAEMASHAKDTSQKLGQTIEGVQELEYVAKLSDVSIGALDGGLNRLERTLDKVAKTGKGPAADALRKLHISASSIVKLPIEEKLGIIADKFKALPDGAEKSAIALQLKLQEMLPLLNQGSDGIQELRDEAHRFGVVIDEETVLRLADVNDNFARVSENLRGFKIQIASALLPAIEEITNAFLEWLAANREWLELGIDTAINALITVFETLGRVISAGIEFLKNHKAILVAIGVTLLVFLLPAIYGLVGATAAWAIATLAALAPWIALGAAVYGVIELLRSLWDDNDSEGYTMADAWEATKLIAQDFADWLRGFAKDAGAWMKGFSDSIGGIKGAFEALAYAAKVTWQTIKDSAKEAWDSISNIPGLKQLIDGIGYLKNSGRQGSYQSAYNIASSVNGPNSIEAIRIRDAAERAGVGIDVAHAPVTIQGGPVNINVQGTHLTPEELRDVVAKHVGDAQTEAIRAAYQKLGGGKRP